MRKTMRTAVVTAAIAGLGFAGAGVAAADSETEGAFGAQKSDSASLEGGKFSVNADTGVQGAGFSASKTSDASLGGKFEHEHGLMGD